MAKQFYLFILLTIIFFIFPRSSFAVGNPYAAHCVTFKATVQADNWPDPNATVKVWCDGFMNHINLDDGCPGESHLMHPGDPEIDLDTCNCYYNQCLQVDDLPPTCKVDPPQYCYSNQNVIPAPIHITCIPPETTPPVESQTPTPTQPSTPRVCEYKTECSTPYCCLGNKATCVKCNTGNPSPDRASCEQTETSTPCANNEVCNNNKCQPPPSTPGVTPAHSPTPTPVPGQSGTPTPPITPGPGQSGTPPPGGGTPIVPNNAPTPIPAFNPATCKCNGITTTGIFAGQQVTITAKAIVEGEDVTKAKVQSMIFNFGKGDNTNATIIAHSQPITPKITKNTPTTIEYEAQWTVMIPANIDPKAVYRIWVNIDCQKKSAGTASVASLTITPTHTANPSFFQKIITFIQGIFGYHPAQPLSIAVTPAGKNPTPATMTSEMKHFQTAAVNTTPEQLQLKAIYPGQIIANSCTFIRLDSTGFTGNSESSNIKFSQ